MKLYIFIDIHDQKLQLIVAGFYKKCIFQLLIFRKKKYKQVEGVDKFTFF